MNFYQRCPAERGYPRFVLATFLDGDWTPIPDRTDSIPATQNGMGILSYLKFHELRGQRDPKYLRTAQAMGDYLVKETLTPNSGAYPKFTRSTGKRDQFPQPADCGSQADRPYEIEPDKGGIAGYALVLLSDAVGERRYLDQALQNARVLAANQQDGDAAHSPWPFRADYRNGEGRGPVSGNMTYILRLYDALLSHGYEEFSVPRRSLWDWIRRHQIPNAAADGSLFAQFFEDHDTPTNRTAWAPLNLARYLLERRELLDPDWRADCATLIGRLRSQRSFTHEEFRASPFVTSRMKTGRPGAASIRLTGLCWRCTRRPPGPSPWPPKLGKRWISLSIRSTNWAVRAIYPSTPYPAAGRRMRTRTSSTIMWTPCVRSPRMGRHQMRPGDTR